ncbi:MAG: hypothetical protein P4N59_14255 [Negativicutes bacterium]|nr:hypothetical protein [Negativicutes bacterium]
MSKKNRLPQPNELDFYILLVKFESTSNPAKKAAKYESLQSSMIAGFKDRLGQPGCQYHSPISFQ